MAGVPLEDILATLPHEAWLPVIEVVQHVHPALAWPFAQALLVQKGVRVEELRVRNVLVKMGSGGSASLFPGTGVQSKLKQLQALCPGEPTVLVREGRQWCPFCPRNRLELQDGRVCCSCSCVAF